jgi:hypothetical protein
VARAWRYPSPISSRLAPEPVRDRRPTQICACGNKRVALAKPRLSEGTCPGELGTRARRTEASEPQVSREPTA